MGVAEWRFMFRQFWDYFELVWVVHGGRSGRVGWVKRDMGDRLFCSYCLATISFWAAPALLLVGVCRSIFNDDPVKFARIIGGRTKGMKVEEKERLAKSLAKAEHELGLGEEGANPAN